MAEIQENMGKLKQCPFCGGKAATYFEAEVGRGGWHVGCSEANDYAYSCRGHIDYSDYESESQAIHAWNTRANKHHDITSVPLDRINLSSMRK